MYRASTGEKCLVIFTICALAFLGRSVAAEESSRDLQELRKEIQELKKNAKEKDKALETLERKVDELERQPLKETPPKTTSGSSSALDQALEQIDQPSAASQAAKEPRSSGLYSVPLGSAASLRLLDLSVDILFAAGGSTEDNNSLQTLQGGDHDPKTRGFTLGQAELSLAGAVDPYFTGQANVVFKIDALTGDSEVELEEAFLKTLALPWGLQAKAGYYLTEFGRLNPTHPHAWIWMDQPIILTRVFGPDGLRTPGARVSWLAPVPWFMELYLGVQNAYGETAQSFLGSPDISIGGHPFVNRNINGPGELLYSARMVHAFNPSDTVTTQIGASGLVGPNSTGPQGKTFIYGGDLTVKWKPRDNFRGWPFLIFESEIVERIYKADAFANAGNPADPSDDVFFGQEVLKDYGAYAQLDYGFYPRWSAGVRYDFANGDDQTFVNRHLNPFRDARQRVSPLVTFFPSEFSRLRLQFNYDHADHLANDAYSVWGGFEILFGAHPPHSF